MSVAIVLKIVLSVGLIVFLLGLGMISMRSTIYGKIHGVSLGLKGVWAAAIISAAWIPNISIWLSLVGLVAMIFLIVSLIVGIALGLRSRFQGNLLDYDQEANLRH